MANETKVQAFIHLPKKGAGVGRILFILLLAAIASVYIIVILGQFKGLDNDKGMDQAQVGRQLATGHGFTTKFVRPIAYGQFTRVHGGALPAGDLPDTYNAPLNPFVDSLLFRFQGVAAKVCTAIAPKLPIPGIQPVIQGIGDSDVPMTSKDIVFPKDRLIAGASLLFYIISIWFNYIIALRLFDKRLALLGMGLLVVCDVYWQFALTGLPQNLMVLIFSLVNYCQVRAIENQKAGKNFLLWLGLSGVGFGLLVLAHGLAIWLFAGALLYMGFAFLPREGVWWVRGLLHPAWVPLLVVVAMEGSVAAAALTISRAIHSAIALYSGYGQLLGTESQVMRSLSLDASQLTFAWFRSKVQAQTIFQFSNIYSFLGHSPIAPVFFVSLLHLFKRPETASFRWCVLYMWIFGVLGMSLFGLNETGDIHANDLHILFVPMTIFSTGWPSCPWCSGAGSRCRALGDQSLDCPLELPDRGLRALRLPARAHAAHHLRPRPVAPLCAAVHRHPGRVDQSG